MSPDPLDPAPSAAKPDPGPLGELPALTRRQLALQRRLSGLLRDGRLGSALAWLVESTGASVRLDQPEVVWRASGLQRAGVVAQMSWPRLASRFAVGLDTPLAHAVVDRLLGYDRLPVEGRLQVSPVEWGILTFVVAETLTKLTDTDTDTDGGLGPWDFTLDRLGPDGLNPSGLGPIVTIRWTVQVGPVTGSARLWLPEALVALSLASGSGTNPTAPHDPGDLRERFGELGTLWRAEAGTIPLPRGLARLRVGVVLPLVDTRLGGSAQSPSGAVDLAAIDAEGRCSFPAELTEGGGGGRLTLTGPLERKAIPPEANLVSTSSDPTDAPVTLVVELGRVNLPLRTLADLKPGDVVELGRHAREPIELTSGGRLVARGELVQIDTELGVRVTSVLL